MAYWRTWISRNQPAIWLLVIALLVQLLAQLHMHLHHADSSQTQGHDHVIDYHMLADSHADDHFTHENTHELKSSPPAIAKKLLDMDSVFILNTGLLLLLSMLTRQTRRWNPLPFNVLHKSWYYLLSPPLRAPPAN